ncbi:MAG: O-antigen ligase family protein [Acidimicrobiia bacterium]
MTVASQYTAIFVVVGLIFSGLLALALVLSRNRALVFMVFLVIGLAFPLHKQIGRLDFTVRSGAPGYLVSLTMVLLVVLYGMWFADGTFKRDAVRALRRPVFWVPPIALLLSSFSMIRAVDDYLAISHVFYMLVTYALFFYFGARVRSRSEVLWIAASMGMIVLIEAPIVLIQKYTGGFFGVSLLGVSTSLTRVSEIGDVNRPPGTLIHPGFLAIVVAMVALLALGLALFHTNRWVRLGGVAIVVVSLLEIYLTSTRGPFLGLIPAMAVMVAISAAQHRLSVRGWVTAIFLVVSVLLVFSPQLVKLYEVNFGQKQRFSNEVEARLQLNRVGERMIESSPLVGVGLNNYMQVQQYFIEEPLYFRTYPAHNLFVLTTAETGLIGLAGLIAIGVSLAWNGLRLGLRRDPLGRALGWTMIGVLLLNFIADQFSYNLRIEVPLNLFWIIAGLTMAGVRIQEDEQREREASAEIPLPPAPPRSFDAPPGRRDAVPV